MRNPKLLSMLFALVLLGITQKCAAQGSPDSAAVTVSEDASSFTLSNGLLVAQVDKRTGTLSSLKYQNTELMAREKGHADGGYWSSVGRGRTGSRREASIRINPSTNGGELAEVSCRQFNDPASPDGGLDADYRYELGRGQQGIYVYAVLRHQPGYPTYGVGEARYCLKLSPEVFDFLSIDAARQRLMPSGYDWDHGSPLNMKEARRLTTGIHKGEVEHKYDYSASLSETPAYGWSSSTRQLGLWLINPSIEYLGGGPTKVELTGHLDVNPGGLPVLLNMWVGSHYGGTSLVVASAEDWVKVVGPFMVYCNSGMKPEGLWKNALTQAAHEQTHWPYAWLNESNYPSASKRSSVSGQIILSDPSAPALKMSNLWVGVTTPDYTPPAMPRFNFPDQKDVRAQGFRRGFPTLIDWQRDAKYYQYWSRGDAEGRFEVNHVRAGNYTLHAIAEGVLGELTVTNVIVKPGENLQLGKLDWKPVRFGETVWEIGVPDRTAREFRHGDHFWKWGLYYDYEKDFPHEVDFTIGESDWHRDWNYAQPPRILTKDTGIVSEDDEQREDAAMKSAGPGGGGRVQSSVWSIHFQMPSEPKGRATLRLAVCGSHQGCEVEIMVNGVSAGSTGELPGSSTMQRDGIRGFWLEKDIEFNASLLKQGTNTIQLLSHAKSWNQGVEYDYLRLELNQESVTRQP